MSHTCSGFPVTIGGTSANDVIRGTEGRDVISAGSGNDIVIALAGHDVVCGGDGADVVFAGTGNDVMLGEGGDDELLGGTNEDVIQGGTGIDALLGGAGNDALIGGAGRDLLVGQEGFADQAQYLDSPVGVHVNLAIGTAVARSADPAARAHVDDRLVDVERLVGSTHADVLIGDAQQNSFIGLQGDDLIDGGPGNEADSVKYNWLDEPVRVDLSRQFATGVGLATPEEKRQGRDRLIHIEDVTGSIGDDTLIGDAGRNSLGGRVGNDKLIGLGGDDILGGQEGDDTFDGGDSNDTCDGGIGFDHAIRCEITLFIP